MSTYHFRSQLAFSRSIVRSTYFEAIRFMLPGVLKIEQSAVAEDKNGIDYWVTLRTGARVGVDHKTRAKGCSAYWKNGEPELSLEKWSVMPTPTTPGKAGWTLSESKETDYTFHTFDPSDTNQCYLLPFQLLRAVFRQNIEKWENAFAPPAVQSSGYWLSQCIFVPAHVILNAIKDAMIFRKAR